MRVSIARWGATIDRILIIRSSAIGDVIFASPLIGALRRKYPQAHIAWLAEPPVEDLLRRHPQLDEVLVWDKAGWKRLWRARRYRTLWRAFRAFVGQLRRSRFDTAIDAQGLLKSGIWAWLSGARRRIGLGSREGSARLMTEVVDKPRDSDLIGSEYRQLANHLGLQTEPFPMHVGLWPEDEACVEALRQQHRLDDGYAVICPFTTRPQKHWFADHWIELIGRLRHDFGLPVVMLGGPADKPAAAGIAAYAEVIDLTGRTRIPEAAAVIRHCRLLVGVDTGLTHLGTAFERPTVCLFGSTSPYLRTDSPLTRVIWHGLACSPCRRKPTCGGAFTCMREINPAEVVQQCKALLESAS